MDISKARTKSFRKDRTLFQSNVAWPGTKCFIFMQGSTSRVETTKEGPEFHQKDSLDLLFAFVSLLFNIS